MPKQCRFSGAEGFLGLRIWESKAVQFVRVLAAPLVTVMVALVVVLVVLVLELEPRLSSRSVGFVLMELLAKANVILVRLVCFMTTVQCSRYLQDGPPPKRVEGLTHAARPMYSLLPMERRGDSLRYMQFAFADDRAWSGMSPNLKQHHGARNPA